MTVIEEFGTITVEDAGLGFSLEYNGDGVEVEIEFPDYGSWSVSSPPACTRYATICAEDWKAIVEWVASERQKA